MIKKHTYKDLVWIDLLKPTQKEVRQMMEEYNIHPNIANDLLGSTFKQSVRLYENFLYVVMRFPAVKHTHKEEADQEIDFIISDKVLITSRYDTIDPIHKFSKVFDTNTILDKENIGSHANQLFFLLMNKLYGAIDHELEIIEGALDESEDMIFKGEERKMVKELSNISRDLLNIKQATNIHESLLVDLKNNGSKLFDAKFGKSVDSIVDEYYKMRKEIEVNRESLDELRDTNDSLLSTKQNETMMVLTIMAFVTFPLSLLASIFGMNAKNMPIIGDTYDFWIIVGIMFVMTAMFFLYFKSKKWL